MTACYGAAQYAFAGTEYADECWCKILKSSLKALTCLIPILSVLFFNRGNANSVLITGGSTPPPLANAALDEYCDMACPGDQNYACGGSNYISVYYDPTKYTAGADPSLYGPQTVQKAGNYSYIGCYSEATTGRALSALQPTAPATGFTIESCEAACQGYSYFGMEYANECYCGNTIHAGSVAQANNTPSINGCDMICKGTDLEFCGGSDRLNMYRAGVAASSSPSAKATSSTPSKSSSIISSMSVASSQFAVKPISSSSTSGKLSSTTSQAIS